MPHALSLIADILNMYVRNNRTSSYRESTFPDKRRIGADCKSADESSRQLTNYLQRLSIMCFLFQGFLEVIDNIIRNDERR